MSLSPDSESARSSGGTRGFGDPALERWGSGSQISDDRFGHVVQALDVALVVPGEQRVAKRADGTLGGTIITFGRCVAPRRDGLRDPVQVGPNIGVGNHDRLSEALAGFLPEAVRMPPKVVGPAVGASRLPAVVRAARPRHVPEPRPRNSETDIDLG